MLTVDRTHFAAWCEGTLLHFVNGCLIIVNEAECAAAAEAIDRGEAVMLRDGAALTGTEVVLQDGAYVERPSAQRTGGL
jgi:hypothetical protein